MTQSSLRKADEKDLGYGQIFAILLRRRFYVLSVFFGILSTAIVLTIIEKPTYQSSMQLLVEPNYQGRTEQGAQQNPEDQFADSNVEVDNSTQLNLMRSTQLIQKAVDLLQPEYPEISVDGSENGIRKSLMLTQVVEKGADSKQVGTKIFQAVYVDDDRIKTQKVLKAIQRVYQDYNIEQQKLRLTKGLSFINEQLPQVQAKVDQAQAALEKFSRNHNLIAPELQSRDLVNALNTVRENQRINRVQLQNAQARYAALQQQSALTPRKALVASRLSQSYRYQNLLNEIQKTDLSLAQAQLKLTDTNPSVQSLQARRQSQLDLLRQELERIVAGVPEQQNDIEERPIAEGQLGQLDLNLAGQLVEAQVYLQSLMASAQGLAQAEQQLQAQVSPFPSLLVEYNRLQLDVQVNSNTLQQLLKARQELGLEFARGGFDWQVVEEPQPGKQISPNIKTNLLLGIVIGLISACTVAFIREALDDAVHTSDELKRQVSLPLLGITPELPQATRVSQPIANLSINRLPVMEPSMLQMVCWAPFRDSLDLIYKNIILLNDALSLKSLVVTSALAGEGKTTLALGLATTAARLHQRVLLIDTDLRRPSLHKQLNLPNDQGLSTLLTSNATLPSQTSIQYSESCIDVLTSGPTPADPVKLLSSPRMKELLAAFEQNYDLVLLDAPPVLGMVDAIQAASLCSGVVLVGRIGRVTRTEVVQATEMLSKSNVIGVIANGTSGPANSNVPYTDQKESLPLRLYPTLVPAKGATTGNLT